MIFSNSCIVPVIKFALFLWFQDGATKKIYFQFQCVTWKLDKALIDIPYDDFNISEEVQEQVSVNFE